LPVRPFALSILYWRLVDGTFAGVGLNRVTSLFNPCRRPIAVQKAVSVRRIRTCSSAKEILADSEACFRLKTFELQVLFRFKHLQVCACKNRNDIIPRILRFISEGISVNLSIPPNYSATVFFCVNGPVSFGSVNL
jgi:hypothetical protein